MAKIESSQEELTKLTESIQSVSENTDHLADQIIFQEGKINAFGAFRENGMKLLESCLTEQSKESIS